MRLVFCLKCARVTGRKRAANEQLRTGVQPHLQALRVSAIADFGGQQNAAAAVFPAGCARDPPQTDTMGGGEVRWQHQRSVLEPNGIPARCRCPGGILT